MGKVGDVIAQQVEEAMLGFRRDLDVATIEENTPARALLRSRKGIGCQNPKTNTGLLSATPRIALDPSGQVQKVVEVALSVAGQPSLQPANLEGAFVVPPLKGTWASAKEGLIYPFTGEERPIVFDENSPHGDEKVVWRH
ncbi:MAG UNVERIFIED_CONTAM: hypothetical protein LVT10_00910 [Anaerolineae bacterium]|jgi:hypothetical protein